LSILTHRQQNSSLTSYHCSTTCITTEYL